MFQSNCLPQLRLDTTLPNFSRNIEPIVQPYGSEIFRAGVRLLMETLFSKFKTHNVGVFIVIQTIEQSPVFIHCDGSNCEV